MNISDVKFEAHCFYNSVFYNFSCAPYNVITFLICIIEKHQYLWNEKRYSKKENVIIIFFEKPFK